MIMALAIIYFKTAISTQIEMNVLDSPSVSVITIVGHLL